jgi:hypothetical protein
MFTFRTPLLLLVVVGLAGCASGVKRAEDTSKREAYFAKGGKLANAVTISLTKEAQAMLADNPGFDREKLLASVRHALEARDLMAKTADPALPKIEIRVTDIRVRSNFSAVMFGFMAGDDRVAGDVIARDPSGKELQRFTVSASYALGGFGGGQDDARMSWLYEAFARQTVEELTGEKKD